MNKPSSGVRTLSVTVRVQIDANVPEFLEAQHFIGPGASARHVVASEILSNLESVGYVRWARINGMRGPEAATDLNDLSQRSL